MKNVFSDSLKAILFFSILTGLVYPLMITGFSQVLFTIQSNGSLIEQNGIVIGSELIGQSFTQPKYFWPRPSAIDYNPLPSGGSNLSLTSHSLSKNFQERLQQGLSDEMLFMSASGLDPHISPAAAKNQISRIIASRPGLTEKLIEDLISQSIEEREFAVLGEPRINVLKLNLKLDKLISNSQ